MACTLHVAWDERLSDYYFGPDHPLAPVRVELTMRLAHEFGRRRSWAPTMGADVCGQRPGCGGGSLIATGVSRLSRCDSPRMRTFSGSPSSTR
jgi:hypothetical protein